MRLHMIENSFGCAFKKCLLFRRFWTAGQVFFDVKLLANEEHTAFLLLQISHVAIKLYHWKYLWENFFPVGQKQVDDIVINRRLSRIFGFQTNSYITPLHNHEMGH